MASISGYINKIKTALYGKDVRGSLADGLEAVNKETEASTKLSQETQGKQEHLEKRWDAVVAGTTNGAEVIDGRVDAEGKSHSLLKQRLDSDYKKNADKIGVLQENIASQFTNLVTNLKYPPAPLVAAKGNGLADDTVVIQNIISNLAEGSKLYIPDGVYRITSNLRCTKSNVSFEGVGTKSVLRYDYEQQATDVLRDKSLLVFEEGVKNVTLRNFVAKYVGTFDTGSTYSGLIAGITFKNYCENILIEGVEATGFNREGIAFASEFSDRFAKNVKVTRCNLHHNRVAGLWFQNSERVSVIDNDLNNNGLPADDQTGYGVSFQGTDDGSPNFSQVISNRCFNNVRKGIDYHAGLNAVIESNICYKNGLNGIFAYGGRCENIFVKNNVIANLKTGSSSITVKCPIHIGKEKGAQILPSVSYIIEGNEIFDIDVDPYTTEGNVIRVGANLDKAVVSIKNNRINVNRISSVCQIRDAPTSFTDIKVDITNNDISIGDNSTPNAFQIRGSFINFSHNRVTQNSIAAKNSNGLVNIIDWLTNTKHVVCLANSIKSDNIAFDGIVVHPAHDSWVNIVNYDYNFINGLKDKLTIGNRRIYWDVAPPSFGRFNKGDTVWNTNPVELGIVGSKYIINSWKKVTNSSTNIIGTDWLEMRTLTGN